MFKVKSKHSLPICIYQFLLWHLSYVNQRDGCRTGEGPAVHRKKHSSAWIGVQAQARAEAAASANAALVGEGSMVFPNGAPVQCRTDWIPCPQFGSQARFYRQWNASWYCPPVCGLVHTQGSGDHKGKVLRVHPWGLNWALHGFLLSYIITHGALELQEMISAQSAALACKKTESLLQVSFCDLCLKICCALVS